MSKQGTQCYESLRESEDLHFPGHLVIKTSSSDAGGTGLRPSQGTKVSHATRCSQTGKKKKNPSLKKRESESLLVQELKKCHAERITPTAVKGKR